MKETISKAFTVSSTLFMFASSLYAIKPNLPDAAPLNFNPPQGQRRVLKNGMTVYILKDSSLPIMRVIAKVKTGKIQDPMEKIGLAELAASLLKDGGTKKYKPEEIDRELEFLGASIHSGMKMEEANVAMRCLSKDFKKVFDIYSDVLMNPSFNNDKFNLLKDEALEVLRRRNDNTSSQASREAIRMFYGKNHPYGWRSEIKTIKKISKKDLIDFHSNFYRPNNIILAISGDFKNEDEIFEKLNKKFGSWKKNEVKFSKIPPVKIPAKRRVYFIDKEISQTYLVVLQKGIKRHDPIEFPLSVGNQILGGGLSSRLSLEIRSKKGLAYTVYSYFNKRPDYAYIFSYCGTKPETYSQALEEMLLQFKKMKNESVTLDELNTAKNSMTNSFVFRFPTPFSLIEERASYELYGYKSDYLDTYTQQIETVSRKSVAAATKKLFNPDNAMIFVIGNSKKFDKPLSTFGEVIELKDE